MDLHDLLSYLGLFVIVFGMAWNDGVDRATGYIVTATNWNDLIGAAGSLMQLKSHAHGGTTGEGSQSIGPLILEDFTDAAAPAAPSAGRTRLYSVSGRLGFRPNAGADTIIAATTVAGLDLATHAARHNAAGADALAIDAAAATGSLRTLGTNATQAATGNHTHGEASAVLASRPNQNVIASDTRFMGVFQFASEAVSATEAPIEILVPRAGTARNLRLRTTTGQPASGSLVITLRKNGVDTAIVITIAASAAAGTFTDLVNTVSFAAGDRLSIKLLNNATSASTTIENFSLEYAA